MQILKYAVLFVVLLLVQALILNRIEMTALSINPMIYIFFLMQIPFDTPKIVGLVLGIVLGLCMDLLSQTSGVHTAACLALAYIRPALLFRLRGREEYDKGGAPSVNEFGTKWVLIYTMIMVLIHHTIYFMVTLFSFQSFKITLLRIILSSVFSGVVIFLIMIGFYKNKN